MRPAAAIIGRDGLAGPAHQVATNLFVEANGQSKPLGAGDRKILVLNGADDPFVKREEYEAAQEDFDAAKADYRVIEYPATQCTRSQPRSHRTRQEVRPAAPV
jgi:predicted esterase